jgi:S1-C subfamily serine protease
LPAPGADTGAIDSAVALALSPERDARGDLTGWRVRTPPPILAAAGVRAGDILVTVNGRALLSPADIAGIGREAAVSETLVLGLNRDGKPLELRLER